MLGWYLFIGLVMFNIGFFVGIIYSRFAHSTLSVNTTQSHLSKKEGNVNFTENKPYEPTQKEKNVEKDIEFLMNFDGNEKKE